MTYVPDWLPCGHNAHWTMHNSIEKGEPCPLCELNRLNLQIRDYQAALRKVDKCCNCLAYNSKFKALDRGTPEEKCEDCQHEKSYCDCIEKRGSGVSSGDQDTISRPGPQSLADKSVDETEQCPNCPYEKRKGGVCTKCGFIEKRDDGQQIKLQHTADCPCGGCTATRNWRCPTCSTLLSTQRSEKPHGRCVEGHDY